MEIPREFEDFVLEKKLGQGGMGIVYQALQRSLDRKVAIKFLPMAYETEFRDRFLVEARMSAKVNHPNIVSIYSFGIVNDMPYFVMELLEGIILKEVVQRYQQLSFGRLLKLVTQLVEALDCAHEQGIIHRDIKPGNIIVTSRDCVKVIDFGLAKTKSHFASLTQSGGILGTPYYMAPEQAKGESDIDERADLYSAGIVMFELATGMKPFRGDSSQVILYKHIYEPPCRPRDITPNVPAPLEDIILRCLEKDRNRRFQNARELLRALQALHLFPDKPMSVEDSPTMISPSPEGDTRPESPPLQRPNSSGGDKASEEDIDAYLHDVLGKTEEEIKKTPSRSGGPDSSRPASATAAPRPDSTPVPKSARLNPSGNSNPVLSSPPGSDRKKPISRELHELQKTAHRDTIVRRKKPSTLKRLGSLAKKLFTLAILIGVFGLSGSYFYNLWILEKEKLLKEKIKNFVEKLSPPFQIEVNGISWKDEKFILYGNQKNLRVNVTTRVDGRVLQSQVKGTAEKDMIREGLPYYSNQDLFLIPRFDIKTREGEVDLQINHLFQIPSYVMSSLGEEGHKYTGQKHEKITFAIKPFILKEPQDKGLYFPRTLCLSGQCPPHSNLKVFVVESGSKGPFQIMNVEAGQKEDFYQPLHLDKVGKVKLKIQWTHKKKESLFYREIFLARAIKKLELLGKRDDELWPLAGVKVLFYTAQEGEYFSTHTNEKGFAWIPSSSGEIKSGAFVMDGQEIKLPLDLTVKGSRELQVRVPLSKVSLGLKGKDHRPLPAKQIDLRSITGRWIRSLGKTDQDGNLVAWIYPGVYRFFSDGKDFHSETGLVSLERGSKTLEMKPYAAAKEERLWILPFYQLEVFLRLLSNYALYLCLFGLFLGLYLLKRVFWKKKK